MNENNDSNKKNLNIKNLGVVEKMISNMKFGSITLIIQDGVLIQIEKNEKIRLK
ncbi:MAG: YezD family protein [Clostridium sp.]